MQIDPNLYDRWIEFVFDKPESKDGWYFDEQFYDAEFDVSPEAQVDLVGATCQRAGRDLSRFSDLQVAHGLNYIFNNACSNVVFKICQDGVALERRIAAVTSIKALYTDCFAKRCDAGLSHLDYTGAIANPLNGTCYMFWDSSPLGRWKRIVTEVMEFALYLPSFPCIESALHGLGHRASMDDSVSGVLDRFLDKRPYLPRELYAYAQRARVGSVQ